MAEIEIVIEKHEDCGNIATEIVSAKRIDNIFTAIDSISPLEENPEKEAYDAYVEEIKKKSGEEDEFIIRMLLWDLVYISNHVEHIKTLIRLQKNE